MLHGRMSAVFTQTWFYFEELKNFMGKGEVMRCLFACILTRRFQNQDR